MAVKIGIGARLNGLLILIFVIFFVAMAMVLNVTIDKVMSRLEAQAIEHDTRELATSIDGLFAQSKSIMVAYSRAYDLIDNLEASTINRNGQALLEEISQEIPTNEAVILVNQRAVAIGASRSAPILVGTSFARIDTLQSTKKDGFVADYRALPSPVNNTRNIITFSQDITSNGQYLGALVVLFDLSKISAAYLTNKQNSNPGYAVVVNKDHRYILHPNLEKILVEEKDKATKDAINQSTKVPYSTVLFKSLGKDLFVMAGPTSIAPWHAAIIMEEGYIERKQREIFILLFIICLAITGVLALFFNIVVKKRLTSRLLTIKKSMDVASDGDLTINKEVKGHDEISSINESFHQLTGGLSSLINNMNQKMQGLTASSSELSNCIKNTIDAVDHIDNSIKHAKKEVSRQTSSINLTSKAVREISASIEKLDDTISNHASGIKNSTHSMHEMINNIGSIGEMIETASQYTTSLKNQSKEGEQRLTLAISQINNVAKSSNQLVKANSLVAKVASKTTILAMNAAIEAAHAGDQGSGFAVVADEVRNLAELSTAQSRNIQKIISDIASLINVAVGSSQETQESISKIFQTVSNIELLVSSISRLMSEQTAGSQGVLLGLDNMRDVALSVKEDSNSLALNSEDILKNVDELTTISTGMDQVFNQVFTQIQEINQVIEAIKYLDAKNRKGVGAILLASARFKVDEQSAVDEVEEALPEATISIEDDDDIVLF